MFNKKTGWCTESGKNFITIIIILKNTNNAPNVSVHQRADYIICCFTSEKYEIMHKINFLTGLKEMPTNGKRPYSSLPQ